jgi:hypothetical protein
MTLYICTECCEEEAQEQQGCSISKPKTRDVYPIYCSPDGYGRIRVPVWRLVPEKKQARIS